MVVASGVWGLIIPVIAYLDASGILRLVQDATAGRDMPPLPIVLAEGGGYFAVAAIIAALHVIVLRSGRYGARALAAAMAVMFGISFLTGFTIGLFLLPSAFVLLVATIQQLA